MAVQISTVMSLLAVLQFTTLSSLSPVSAGLVVTISTMTEGLNLPQQDM